MGKISLPLLAAGMFAAFLLLPAGAAAQVNKVKDALQEIKAKLDNVPVPFKVMDRVGGICNTAVESVGNPEILIESDATEGNFVVTSILLKTATPGVPATGFVQLSINAVEIDSELFDTRTGNLLGPTDGSGVLETGDLMGTPIRRSGDAANPVPGGNFPYQIVADSNGANDIRIRLFCRSDDDDFNIETILVAGWKRPADTITVTYIPGR